ncbi:hypothetical protein K488DRAFT_82513 [Vararia minispora EC-137]|uniref:Uncharacterized protein n=1 Tax=Vararia minispora EC-137 TaxID=1314806 RepID=A0ACB8QWP5_9AGAM|nr:hypothetical protein K488DRAFT_82513 [Vararia minispora EC-137]
MQLLDLPEEILCIILQSMYRKPVLQAHQLLLYGEEVCNSDSLSGPSFTSIVRLNRTLNRIGVPILYHTVHLPESLIAQMLARTLESAPEKYAQHIRTLSARHVFPALITIFHALDSTRVPLLAHLDIPLEVRHSYIEIYDHCALLDQGPGSTSHAEASRDLRAHVASALGPALATLAPGPCSLVLRRPTCETAARGAACALATWSALRRVELAFFPFESLAGTLACAPSLTALRMPLPNAWTPSALCIADNPALERVELFTLHLAPRTNAPAAPAPDGGAQAVPAPAWGDRRPWRKRPPLTYLLRPDMFYDKAGYGLIELWLLTRAQIERDEEGAQSGWLAEARKHPRLKELLLAGALDGEEFDGDDEAGN